MSGYGSMGDEGREGMGRMKEDIQQKTGDVMGQAREQTGQAMEQARGSAFQMMDQQKSRAAEGLGSVAHALHQTADSLEGNDQGAIGQYAHRAADTVEQISNQLRDKSVEQLLSEAERFARREPEVFLGGAVLLGLLASRFLKASNRRSQMRDYGYDRYGYRAGYGSDYGRTGMGPGGYDRGAWSGEGIDYRTTGTGGYRTTVSGSGVYGSTTDESAFSGDITAGRERASTSRVQRHSDAMGSEIEDTSWMSEDDEMPGGGTGSSRA